MSNVVAARDEELCHSIALQNGMLNSGRSGRDSETCVCDSLPSISSIAATPVALVIRHCLYDHTTAARCWDPTHMAHIPTVETASIGTDRQVSTTPHSQQSGADVRKNFRP